MSRQKKKFLSLLIIVCLLVTALPVQAGAAEADKGQPLYIGETEENGNNNSNNSNNQNLYNNENTENISSETVNTDEENALAVYAVDEENGLAAHAEPSGYWKDNLGNETGSYNGGYGSKADPYQIATAEQLAYLAEQVNTKPADVKGKYFQLTADIDLSEHYWVPIGYGTYFSGYFDGDGHTITGLCIEENSTYTWVGLFGAVVKASNDDEPVLKNLRIENASISGTFSATSSQSGILAGKIGVDGGVTTLAAIENCSVAGTIDVKSLCVGGLCGGGAECEGDKLYVFCNCDK